MSPWPFSGMRTVLVTSVAVQSGVDGKDQGDELRGIGDVNSAGIVGNAAMRPLIRETSADRLEYALVRVIL